MKIAAAFHIIFLLLLQTKGCWAGVSAEQYHDTSATGDPDYYFKDPTYNWVLLKVLKNVSTNGTNENPPISEVKVIKSLTANLENGEKFVLTWKPNSLDFHGDGSGVKDDQIKKWKVTKINYPVSVGDEVIAPVVQSGESREARIQLLLPPTKFETVKAALLRNLRLREMNENYSNQQKRISRLWETKTNGLSYEQHRLQSELLNKKAESNCQKYNPCRWIPKKPIGAGSSFTFLTSINGDGQVSSLELLNQSLREGVRPELEECTKKSLKSHKFPKADRPTEALISIDYRSTPAPCVGLKPTQ